MPFKHLCLLAIATLTILSACNKEAKQLEEDIDLIQQYLADNNLVAEITPESVYYIITRVGDGTNPSAASTVKCHYEGFELDGVKFDSSYDRGEPSTFALSNVIQGWQIGIPLLSKGGAGTLLIPSHLAYGNSPPSGISKNAVLRFEVELLDF
jgi:FKBP-type peptidyl-prolyl cis-trans isomerase FkpA